jgi:hypothetical protein
MDLIGCTHSVQTLAPWLDAKAYRPFGTQSIPALSLVTRVREHLAKSLLDPGHLSK